MATATAKKPAKQRTEWVQEFADSRDLSLTVDKDNAVIRGVKILGRTSRNNREYTEQAMTKAVPLYEGATAYVNHSDSGRRYEERIGALKNVRTTSDGLFADLHYNPKHPVAEQLVWDAEHSTRNVGFSHNAKPRYRMAGGKMVIEEIVQVKSVDLVSEPATTKGIFEQEDDMSKTTDPVELLAADLLEVFSGEGETADKTTTIVAKLKEALEAKPVPPVDTTVTEQLTAELATLKEQLAAHQTKEQVAEKLAKAKLSRDVIGEVLYEQLLATKPEAQDKLIEAYRPLVSKHRDPTSRGGAAPQADDAKPSESASDFVKRLKYGG